jgi:hypothetical protein
MTWLWGLIAFVIPTIVFATALKLGRRKSAILLAFFVVLVAATSVLARHLLEQSGQFAWQIDADHPYAIVASAGMGSLNAVESFGKNTSIR